MILESPFTKTLNSTDFIGLFVKIYSWNITLVDGLPWSLEPITSSVNLRQDRAFLVHYSFHQPFVCFRYLLLLVFSVLVMQLCFGRFLPSLPIPVHECAVFYFVVGLNWYNFLIYLLVFLLDFSFFFAFVKFLCFYFVLFVELGNALIFLELFFNRVGLPVIDLLHLPQVTQIQFLPHFGAD